MKCNESCGTDGRDDTGQQIPQPCSGNEEQLFPVLTLLIGVVVGVELWLSLSLPNGWYFDFFNTLYGGSSVLQTYGEQGSPHTTLRAWT